MTVRILERESNSFAQNWLGVTGGRNAHHTLEMIVQNDFARQWKVVEPAVVAAVRRVGSSGWYILAEEVKQFEKALASHCGIAYAVGVANGMDALEIGLRCLDLRPGEKVLTTPYSAFATTLSIVRAGGLPVFVDVDDNGNLDLQQCRDVLARDSSIRFLMPVHLYGNPCDLEKLAALKRDFDLRIVEDCAQAIGAEDRGRVVGSVGQVAGISFYPTKNLGALGDGGALLTNDANLAGSARTLRNYGQTSNYAHDEPGLNSRLDEIQAAIMLDAMLPNLPGWTEKRRDIATRYRSELQTPALRSLSIEQEARPVWHIFPVFTAHKDAFRDHLKKARIETAVHYPRVIPDQTALQRNISAEIAAEPKNARRLATEEVSLPIHAFLREDEISEVIRACNAFAP